MKRPRASARYAQLLADQDHDRRAPGAHEFDNEAVALADSALSDTTLAMMGSRPSPSGRGPV
jgi:hypothetical protein